MNFATEWKRGWNLFKRAIIVLMTALALTFSVIAPAQAYTTTTKYSFTCGYQAGKSDRYYCVQVKYLSRSDGFIRPSAVRILGRPNSAKSVELRFDGQRSFTGSLTNGYWRSTTGAWTRTSGNIYFKGVLVFPNAQPYINIYVGRAY
jgi:hypothetical protein